jgi:uncharacterized damage-inducible protein DinB
MSRLRSQYEALGRYNTWMNQRLYALAETLSDEERKRDLGAFFGSIHGTLNHILLGDRIWLARISGDADRFTSRDASGQPIAHTSLAAELYASFEELQRQRQRTDADLEELVKTFDGEKLDANISYTRAGNACEHPLWWALTHLFNHQTHHRGQVTTLFKQLGHDPGTTDLIALLRDG